MESVDRLYLIKDVFLTSMQPKAVAVSEIDSKYRTQIVCSLRRHSDQLAAVCMCIALLRA